MGVYLKLRTIVDISNQLKLDNKKVVFTHGGFDLFHIGHATLLNLSRKEGDYLVVGVDSNERLAKYKNTQRPIIPLQERIEVLLENKNVDFVFAIDDSLSMQNKYFLNLYKQLNVSIVTCGKNFAFQDKLKQREQLIKGLVIKQISHKFDDLQSTTKIINKIRNYKIRS